MRRRDEERARFVEACKRNGVDPYMARTLMRYAATAQRYATLECNRGLTTAERERCNANRLRIAAWQVLAGMSVDIDGDPRGYVVKVHFPDGSYNTWGGRESGYGVPSGRY
jgi:hypothetical protein